MRKSILFGALFAASAALALPGAAIAGGEKADKMQSSDRAMSGPGKSSESASRTGEAPAHGLDKKSSSSASGQQESNIGSSDSSTSGSSSSSNSGSGASMQDQSSSSQSQSSSGGISVSPQTNSQINPDTSVGGALNNNNLGATGR